MAKNQMFARIPNLGNPATPRRAFSIEVTILEDPDTGGLPCLTRRSGRSRD